VITKKAAELSVLLKSTIMDFQGDIVVPLSEIDDKTLQLVIEYLNHYDGQSPQEIEKPLKSAELKEVTDDWSANFIDNLQLETLVDLTVAANFMEIQPLLDLTCAKIASMCKDKTEDEIFKTFGVTDTFTEEEKAKIREENKWIEDNI
jgi:S-phase kinase-associated protein 1